MKNWVVLGSLLCFAASPASADVSNEVIVGLEADSSNEVKRTVGGVESDLTDRYKTANSLFVAQYTRFLDPLRDDDTPIDLRRFLQHPSSVSAGLAAVSMTTEDTTNPASARETTGNASMLLIGGEYFFPTHTGIFLNLGSGGGTAESKVNGIAQPDADLSVGTYEFGMRQYVAPNAALHLAFTGDSWKSELGGAEQSSKKGVALLGVQGVIRNTVSLELEFGGGRRTEKAAGSADVSFDVGQLNLGIAFYAGKQLSFGFDLEVEAAKQTGLPAGIEYTESTARFTFAAAYWFSERFGMQVPIYSKTSETKSIVGPIETKITETNGGIGLYAGFRF